MNVLCTSPIVYSAMQKAELLHVIATYESSIRAIVENFNWDADTYQKLQSAYREAGKNFWCNLIELQVQYITL